MEWEALIESIGAGVESHERLSMFDEVAELADAEHASVGLAERIRGSLGRYGTITVDGEKLAGQFVESGTDWLVFRHREAIDIIPFHAVEEATGLAVAIAQATRYCPTLNSVLRRLLGTQVRINRLTRAVEGKLQAVGRDYLVVATGQSVTGYSFGAPPADPLQERYLPLAQVKIISQARPC